MNQSTNLHEFCWNFAKIIFHFSENVLLYIFGMFTLYECCRYLSVCIMHLTSKYCQLYVRRRQRSQHEVISLTQRQVQKVDF